MSERELRKVVKAAIDLIAGESVGLEWKSGCADFLKQARAALSQPAPKIGCTERCQRIHPHCELSISRSGAPDHFWHWIVTMPDGHIWDVKGGMTFSEAVESMKADGLYSLEKADERWRETHAAQPPQASEPAEPNNA